jgi:ABC-type multidrug transport system fused ATPase/permease subunit
MIGKALMGRVGLKRVRKGWRKRLGQWSKWGRMAVRLSPYVRKRKGRLALALACGLGYTLVGLLEPWTMKIILDNVILDRPLPSYLARVLAPLSQSRLALLNVMIAAMVVLAASRGVFYYYQKLLTARVGQQATADMRLELYRHLQRLSFAFHDRRRTGDLLARLTSDIRFLRDIFISLPLTIVSELMLVTGMVVVMFVMDWSLTLLALLVLPGLAVMLRLYQGPMRKAVRRQRDREGDIATIASEVLGAIKVVQGFRREEYEVDRFNVENKRSLRTGLKAARLEAKLRWYAEVTVAIVTALVIGVAARRVLVGALSPGDIIVFARYLRTFNRPLRRVSRMAERAARGAAAGERVLEMLEIVPDVRDLPGAVSPPRFKGRIAFEGVSLVRRRRPVLEHVDLEIEPGERVGIVGPTGAGKSTLVSLIPRFYEPSGGRVTIDGQDVREFTLASLREHISFVFQEPILFATTVAENIGYGRPGATREDIVRAAEQAGIHDIISALPDGYDTVIGERGGTLSGGERQCVTIARAIIKDAPIVILDEPTTGLDGWSAAMVVEALKRLMEGRTVVLISHQLGNIRGVDRVIVVDRGRVVDEGTHSALLARNDLYQSLSRFEVQEVAL